MNSSDYEEDTIDLVDLFYYLLKHWRSLLKALAVGIVCGGLIFAAKSTVFRYEPEDEDLLKLEQIYQYQLLYEKQLQYNEEAFVQQLDKDADYVTGELRYYIKAGENTAVLGSLLDITESEGYIDTLRAQLGWQGEDRYIRSVIGYSFSMTRDSSDNITLAEQGAVNEDKTYGTLTYSVRLVEEEDCRALMEYIRTWFEQQNTVYQKQYGPYTVEKLTDVVSDAGDAGVLSAKSDALSTAVGMQETLEEYFDELSGDELKYYNEHYVEDYEVGIVSLIVRFVKWPIVVAVVAGFCWGVWWVVAYLVNGTIRQIEVITGQYKLPLLGRVETKAEKQTKFDRRIDRWENGRKPAPCTPEYLTDALAMMPAEEIVLCQTSSDAASSALIEELKRGSGKPVCSGVLHTGSDVLKAGKKAGGVFLVVALGKTRLEEMKAELRVCELYKLQVLGVIVLG